MKTTHILKYLGLALLALIVGGVITLIYNPKWCQTEHLRHSFGKQILSTPHGSVLNAEPEAVKWSVNSQNASSFEAEHAHLISNNHKIIGLHFYVQPSLAIGFQIVIKIDSLVDSLDVKTGKAGASFRIGTTPIIVYEHQDDAGPETLHDTSQKKYFRHYLVYQINKNQIHELRINGGEKFSGQVNFSIDDEPYSYQFTSILKLQRLERACFNVPAMP